MTVWLNGRLLADDEAQLSVRDHGLTVGDGVFETLKVVEGTPFALSRHLTRLRSSGGRLGLAVPDDGTLRAAVAELLAADGTIGRLRITLTGGDGPPGTERGDAAPTLLLVGGPAAPRQATGSLATVPWARNERSAVAGAKTTSYAENVVALAHARALGADEALFLDTRGNLCEGTGSNVFLVIDGRLLTPALTTGCLAGVTRGLVVEWSGATEVTLPLAALDDATEVFLTSSTRDVQPVSAVDDRTYPTDGPLSRDAASTFARLSAERTDP